MLDHFTNAYEKEHGGSMIIFEFDKSQDAYGFVEALNNVINDYGCATVQDAYDLRGLKTSSTYHDEGWIKPFRDTDVVHLVDGWWTVKLCNSIPLATNVNNTTVHCDGFPIELATMPSEIFNKLLEELDGNSLKTLMEKNARYSSNGDALHNFRKGADIAGGTPAQACWGYLTKHLVALRDMVEKDDFSNREDFLEKCQDSINYIRFLWCIGNDKTTKKENE